MQATSALFASVNTLSPEFFRNLVERLRVTYDLNGVVGLGWSEVVQREDMPALRTRMAQAGFADFGLKPVADPTRWPINVVTMLEPQTPENRALIGPRPAQRGRPTLSSSVRTPARARSPAMLVLAPVWSFDPERRFKGFVYMPIRTADFVRSAVTDRLLQGGADRDLRRRAGRGTN